MIAAVGAAEPKRRSKVLLDRAFCFGCLLICASGPVLIGVGIVTLSVEDKLADNVEAFNLAVNVRKNWTARNSARANAAAKSLLGTASRPPIKFAARDSG